ncbi:type II secretion system protein [Algisphaera agarilytica]|uniref:Prepilin-type N-terminal cleavage/methylation domain-containing protein n=1 Tax=Algisphaera agarilytica TaxID=1385975 RepID=A0A7X0LJU5_9BACT|nr:prepilin-type N-terminal cleavage/methylation domain-containing protein [Algisphaera agarilytica]MBB6429134.1 prepilin-type N-terminal cleavage/methylation domain-containing protein [Algisphaera agarilytica]
MRNHFANYRRRKTAFTLIELLVVISIIALLISILLPALSGARFTANVTRCATQLQQIGRAQAAYTNDYDGFITPANSRSYNDLTNSPAQPGGDVGGNPNHATFDDLLGAGGYDGRGGISAFNDGGTNIIMSNGIPERLPEPAIYLCPLDNFAKTVPDVHGRTYGMNRLETTTNTISGDINPDAPGLAGTEGFSYRIDFVNQGADTFMTGEHIRLQNTTSSLSRSVAGGFAGAEIRAASTNDPAEAVRTFLHHSRQGRESLLATGEISTNWLFVDSHVALVDNDDAHAKSDAAAAGFLTSMYDASK